MNKNSKLGIGILNLKAKNLWRQTQLDVKGLLQNAFRFAVTSKSLGVNWCNYHSMSVRNLELLKSITLQDSTVSSKRENLRHSRAFSKCLQLEEKLPYLTEYSPIGIIG